MTLRRVFTAALLALTAPAAAQTFTEYLIPTPGAKPVGIVTGPDGNLWFTEQSGNKIGKVTPAGVFTEYPVPTAGSLPQQITVGPDGNLWFTEQSGNKIGKVTLADVFTEYPVPTAGGFPQGITTGPDGNLWFTERYGNKIGKVTTTGAFTEYPVPTAGSAPQAIVSAPDGNLWFTEVGGNKIGKVTTTGVFTEYSVPTASSNPAWTTTGPDGNLWFTEAISNKIGKVTTAGVFTEYTIPTTSSLEGIATGRDGNLWFTEFGGNRLGKVKTTGVFTEYPVPTALSWPIAVTTGPDGNLWFTEFNGNKIGRITGPCGNGELDPGEECDDGNTVTDDGCSAHCEVEPCYRCSGAPSVCVPQPVPELYNGSYELGAYAPTSAPTCWIHIAFQPDPAAFSWDASQSKTGDRSVKISASTPNDLRWVQTVSVQSNTDYRLSGWIKTQDVAHSTQAVDAGANLTLVDPVTFFRSAPLLGTNDWTFVTFDFNSESRTQVTLAARLGFFSGITTGTAWFDDLQLTIRAPIPTRTPSPPPPAILNGSFEEGFLLGWTALGSYATTDQYAPPEGVRQAELRSNSALAASTVETVMALDAEALDALGFGTAVQGSGLVQNVTAAAGDMLSFRWQFVSNEVSPAERDDVAFMVLAPLAPIATGTPVLLASVSSQPSGVQCSTLVVPAAGVYLLGFGIVDVGVAGGDSILLVDDVRLGPVSGCPPPTATPSPTASPTPDLRPQPFADDCADALVISSLPYTRVVDARQAAAATDDPHPPCGNGSRRHSVWYRYTAPVNQVLAVDTLHSNYNTILSAYTGSCGALTNVPGACNDDATFLDRWSRISFAAQAGMTYYFLISASGAGGGLLVLNVPAPPTPTPTVILTPISTNTRAPTRTPTVTFTPTLTPTVTPTPTVPPPGDACAAAMVVASLPYGNVTSSIGAGTKAGDPIPACGDGNRSRTIWYQYTSPSGGVLHAHTFGSGDDTILSVYTGTCGALLGVPDACNDDAPGTAGPSEISFVIARETTYYFMISSRGATGALAFSLDGTFLPTRTPTATRTITPSPTLVPPDEYEPDDTRELAKPLACGQVQDHTFSPINEPDWTVFSIAVDSEIYIQAAAVPILLTDAEGNPVEDPYTSSGGVISRRCDENPLPAGIYYVRAQHPPTSQWTYLIKLMCSDCTAPTPTPSPTAAPRCEGDCDNDNVVTIAELVRSVRAALDTAFAADCRAADRNGDGTVTINELVAAVDRALGGCGAQ